jgi:hypothetical protein
LRNFLDQAIELRCRCLVKACSFFHAKKRIASSKRRVPSASTSAVYSGASKLLQHVIAHLGCRPRRGELLSNLVRFEAS